MSETSWKAHLGDRIPPDMGADIDTFAGQIALKKEGKISDVMFAETRLRRGVYGQRYDNGLRDDGTGQQPLVFPCGDLKKGPDTVWDAPGMSRLKIPYGKLTAEQMDLLADLAEEYSDSILHVTTRQDIQLHFVHIEDTVDMLYRLATVGITTREACGNSVRNVTACPFAGVCNDQSFDVTPYAHAYTYYFLGHPDVQGFGRKFKVAFSGCEDHPCGLVGFHDLGAIAVLREDNGEQKRGFKIVVGGGLGAVPVQAKVLTEFCPEEELLPLAQAVSRVFARLGEKRSRARARIKFLVDKIGIDEFRRLVEEERATLRHDDNWTRYVEDIHATAERPLRPGSAIPTENLPEGFEAWSRTNVRPQAQEGYYIATVKMPLGDFTPTQARALADLARKYTGDTMRLTVEQNLIYRWVSGEDLPSLYQALVEIGLGEAGAEGITDVTSCPGTDTCKLGISSSRGLMGEVRKRLSVIRDELHPDVQKLRIKASGCFNSCGQHHVADLGFLGISRQVGGRRVPHFNMVLGGQWTENAKSYGLVVGAVPSKRVPESIQAVTDYYLEHRASDDESFQAFIERVGKREFRNVLKPFQTIPSYEEDPSYYSDWGDPREYSIGDIGVGECAGEIVPIAEFGLQAAEQLLFEAQDLLDEKRPSEAAERGFRAMLTAAQALIRHLDHQVGEEPDDIVAQFRIHLDETEIFHDPYAKGKFANYLFAAHADSASFATADHERAHRLLDEVGHFIEASHACYQRITAQSVAAAE